MKKIYLSMILFLSLFAFGCVAKGSTEIENADKQNNEMPIDEIIEANDGIENTISDLKIDAESINNHEKKIYYFDNVFSSFDYSGKKVDEIYNEELIIEEDCIPFEGVFIGAPVSGKMHFDNSKEEPVIEQIEFIISEDDLSQYDCQEYLYNTYGALIAEGTDEDADGQIYWRRYFTGKNILKYSKKAKDSFYTISIE